MSNPVMNKICLHTQCELVQVSVGARGDNRQTCMQQFIDKTESCNIL